jgi:hypothetical protein
MLFNNISAIPYKYCKTCFHLRRNFAQKSITATIKNEEIAERKHTWIQNTLLFNCNSTEYGEECCRHFVFRSYPVF